MGDFLNSLLGRSAKKKLQDADERGARFTTLLRELRGEEALREFLEVLEHHPDWPQIHFEIMDYAIRRELMGERLYPHLYERLAAKPDDAQLHYAMGLLMQSIHDQARTIWEFEEAIRLREDYAIAYHNLAVAHNRTDPDKAIELWQTAIRLNPRLAEAHFALGAVFMRVGRKREGIESFRRFVPLAYPHLEAFKRHALKEIEAADRRGE